MEGWIMKRPLFQGVCTALVTPFLNGAVNYPMMEQLLRRQLDAGIKAVLIAGTTGEAPTLTIEEKLELFHRAKSFVGDDCLILAGTGCNSTAQTAELSHAAQEEGVDGLLIVSPYYNKATPEGLVAHYLTVAHSVRIPIVLYNVPSRTGVDIPISVYQRLSPLPNVVGVKEAGKELTKITKTCSTCGDFFVWTGNDEYTVPAMSLGAQGVVSVLSNVVPEETKAMTDAMFAGDLDTATALQQHLQPLIDLLFCEVNPIPVKAAMKYLGYDCGGCRLPLTELSQEHKKLLEDYLC
jgi:4-hydroxy-tetrahydrodipicolinate synthase